MSSRSLRLADHPNGTSGTAARMIRGTNVTSNDNDADPPSPHEFGLLSIPQDGLSPLSRAGLLQPRSHMSSASRPSRPRHLGVPHTQEDIRDSTMQLSSLPFRSPLSTQESFIWPTSVGLGPAPEHDTLPSIATSLSSALPPEEHEPIDLAGSGAASTASTAATTPRGHGGTFHPSGLSLLLARQAATQQLTTDEQPTPIARLPQETRSISTRSIVPSASVQEAEPVARSVGATGALPEREREGERAPLLGDIEGSIFSYTMNGHPHEPNGHGVPEAVSKRTTRGVLAGWRYRVSRCASLDNVKGLGVTVVRSLPSVLLGALLNILDGVSYGMISFPATGVYTGLGGVGVSMFFVTAIISQLVYSFGGSGFAGANGSMMIEVVPFFHILANDIAAIVGDDRPHEVIATTIVSFALSSLITGLTFFLLGALRLGSLIGFFPRHILVGCIGGVGVFLIITGLTVCTRMSEDDFTLSWSTLKYLCLNFRILVLWLPAFALAVLLRVITHKYQHQLIFPLYFLIIPAIFYIVVAAARINLQTLREEGWLFNMSTSHEPWYQFYMFYDFHATHWSAIWATLPTQFAMLFFNILHPPLNVPALAVSLNHDVDTDKELVAHGYSNLLAGFLGTVPNYLVYVNTLLFYRVGGDTRVAGLMLAGATAILLFAGTGPIAYIPVMVVGALIFVLGFDLVKEAVWDTRQRVNWSEYITIVSIMVCMTVWDFVIGVLFGIVMSCIFFVVQSSRRRSIRALHTGETVMSTVRRPSAHREYIREVSKQTTVMRLQGFLFFGTITHVEETMRTLVCGPAWDVTPVRFFILDLTLVAGVDMSAAEALVRVQRFLAAKDVVLVFCGFSVESAIGRSLASVGLLDMEGVELFSTFNDALEWTENAYLKAWFAAQKLETQVIELPGRQDGSIRIEESMNTPRRTHLLTAGWRTIARDHSPEYPAAEEAEPYHTLVKAFSSYGAANREEFRPLVRYLERLSLPAGYILWHQGDEPDGLYMIESGVLRAVYHFAEHTRPTEESMVPGTVAGELSALSDSPRNATCTVERPAVVWKLSTGNLKRMEAENSELARRFTKMVLKAAKLDNDILLTALAARQ